MEMDSYVFQKAIFQVDLGRKGEIEEWFFPGYNRSNWKRVDVPGAWDLYNASMWNFEGVGWYCMELPSEQVNEDLLQRLKFGKVSGITKLWINGVKVGDHIGSYLPFEFTVSPYLKPGCINEIVLSVDNEPMSNMLPGNSVIEWIQYGGILREACLITSPYCYIDQVTAITNRYQLDSHVTFNITVFNKSASLISGSIVVSIPSLESVCHIQEYCIPEEQEKLIVPISVQLDQAQIWSLDNPQLYEVAIALHDSNGRIIDQKRSRFGIRSIEVSSNTILLNGEPLHIKGINRYDEYYGYGPTVPAMVIREDLLKAKQAGVNLIRTHYPLDEIHLDIMDEIGLLVMEEIPLNWWMNLAYSAIGLTSESENDQILQSAEITLTDMIQQHSHHPCIIIWSLCNESGTNSPYGIEAMRRLISKAREYDNSRLVTFVAEGNQAGHTAFQEADLVCYNVYYGAMDSYSTPALKLNEITNMVKLPTIQHLQRFAEEYPDKPILITEFGTLGIAELKGDHRHSETYQAQYIQAVWEAIMEVEGIHGGVLWCWTDYYHRRKHQNVPLGQYGVLTVDRKEKEAFYMLKQLFLNNGAEV